MALLAAFAVGCGDDQASSTGTNASGAGGSGTGGSGGNGGNGTGGEGGLGTGGNGTGGGNPSGSGSASVTGSGSGGGGGGGMGAPCVVGVGGCDVGYYCESAACGAGACVPKPPPGIQSQAKAVVCGCDGVTYWNAEVATAFGASVKAMGECAPADSVPCNPQTPCASGLSCNRKVTGAGMCGPTATGFCWGLPLSCALDGPQGKGCTGGLCYPECSLVQSQNPWYPDAACP